jgi:hypothetical protein
MTIYIICSGGGGGGRWVVYCRRKREGRTLSFYVFVGVDGGILVVTLGQIQVEEEVYVNFE